MKGYILKPVVVLMALALGLQSCKTNKRIVEEGTADRLPVKTIIRNHDDNKLDFKTIRGRIKIEFDDGYQSQSHNLSFRMEKDKAIWLSATLSLAKAYITPTRVSFYNKLQNEFFDGDFSYLSNLLGTELDFNKVQNMLLGEAIFDLKDEKYRASVVNNNYQLKPSREFDLFKRLFLIEPSNYKMSLQQISQPEVNRVLNIDYKAYQKVENKVFPERIVITAEEADSKVKIEIDYRNVEFNQRVSFPYKIPKGFKEIVLK
ncbi:DUF4292 domain-containing protein [Leptobacterium flavescens]|uniref:DUF4292 domain-containing protein n=1 Tax=Leptobacterium flavescens TaxID=472055 RepID=A0A6P0ULB3_9FLAO|nr:DUF4292 domain-containing protein [Leptobacterium flavescens]NER13210.1 DUF4292 domain-containing protein [Leptobacterium flavescens]